MYYINIFGKLILLYINIEFITALRVNDTCLPELGLRINMTMRNPWGTTDQLIRDIYVYFEELEGILKEIKEGIEEGLNPKKYLVHQIQKFQEVNYTGGPIHLQSPVVIRPLIDFYKWDRENIAEFYELLQFTRETWKELNALLSDEPQPLLTLKERIKLNPEKYYN